MKITKIIGLLLYLLICINPSLAIAISDNDNLGFFHEARVRNLSQFQGLSSSKITSIVKDRKGYIWIGTNNGLNRHDGTTITWFYHDSENPNSIGNDEISALFVDQSGTFWVGTKAGLYIFQPDTQSFLRETINPNEPEFIYSICEDPDGNIWLGTDYGIIKFNPENKNYERMNFLNARLIQEKNSYKLFIDHQGILWIGTWLNGIFRMNPITGEYDKVSFPGLENNAVLKTGHITDIKEGPDGSIWFGGWGYGLLKIDPDRQDIQWYNHDDSNPNSLNNNQIKSLAFDEEGYLWIGMEEAGLDKFAPESEIFTHYFNDFQAHDTYEGPSVYTIMIDDQSLMWLGFRNDGVKIVPLSASVFESYKSPNDEYGTVFSLCETPEGIYTGVKGALEVIDLKTKLIKSIWLPNRETPIAIHNHGESTIFVGTAKGSLFRYNTKTGQFSDIANRTLKQELLDQKIECFYSLSDDELLIGTKKGLYKLDLISQKYKQIFSGWVHAVHAGMNESIWAICWGDFYQYFPKTGKLVKHVTFANGDIKSVYFSTNDGTIFLGTDLGFYTQNIKTGETHLYRYIFPFKNNQVNSIVADNQSHFWLTSQNDLIFFNQLDNKFKTYDEKDGLPNMRFYDGVGIKLDNGSIAFGGEGGILIFDPLRIEDKENGSNLTFTKMTIPNKSLDKTTNTNNPNEVDISEMNDISLQYRQNIITFHFSLLSYINPEKHRYQYNLEGFNEQWFDLGNQNSVTFTNLDPGNYTLKIKAANEQNNWSTVEALHIHVKPPIYQTWYAYVAYVLVIILIIFLIRQFYKNRAKLESRLRDEHLQFEKMKAMASQESDFSQMRLRFFTNISHEFRTPLTLILGPLDNFIKNHRKPTEEHLHLMYKNAERLQRLITQILDFRSMESDNLKFEPSWGDVIQFVKDTAQLFLPMSQQKGIDFKINAHSSNFHAWFDRDKLEKIIYNLLSNAFKHTQNGKIIIDIFTHEHHPLHNNAKQDSTEYQQYLVLKVMDSGNGIPTDKLPHIFDRFFHLQSNNSNHVQGTGIGLALTKELVSIHNGEITVSSKLNTGSTFTVIIPLKTQKQEQDDPQNELINLLEMENILLNVPETNDTLDKIADESTFPTILVVEDNEDLREYMHVEFRHKYHLIDAENGRVGLEKAFKSIPDLIISDLIMPEMDGIEFCQIVKGDERTSHIPVIILTAHGSHINKIRGYEIGADDYVTKPFSSELLILRIENLLKSRKELQTKFSREVRLQPKDLAISSMDERFLNKAMEVVEQNLNNSDFNADSFASEMCMSRVHLYRKLKALTDLSVSDFVKTARLKLASKLIGENKLTIKEAAYTVGFKDPKYFSKCFKQQFGLKPSEYHEVPMDE